MIVYLRKNNFCKFSIFFLVSVKLICEFCFMNTSSFGPCGWQFMFFVAAGYDMNETPKIEKDKQYKHFFKSIGDCLPCKYCRQSYGIFYEKLKIEEYMKMPSCGLIKFVYDLKQLVNQKLWVQETKALQNEFNNLKETYNNDDPKMWEIMREKAQKICYTKPAPEFDKVIDDLMKHRAGCSDHMKSCRIPFNNNNNNNNGGFKKPHFDSADMEVLDPNNSGFRDKEVYSGGINNKKRSRQHLRKKSKPFRKVSRKPSRKPSRNRIQSRRSTSGRK